MPKKTKKRKDTGRPKPRKKFPVPIAWIVVVVIAVAFAVAKETGALEALGQAIERRYVDASIKLGFVVKEVYISGHSQVTTQQIIKAVGAYENTPIFSLSLPDAKATLENIGWVSKATISRQLPSTIHVKIEERKPFAIWQHKGKIRLIDIEGNIISQGDTQGYTDIPIIVGEDANLYVKSLFEFMVHDPATMKKVASLIRVSGRRWNVRMDNGIEIKLPEDDPVKAWQNLVQMHKDEKILDRSIKSIDMRVDGKVYIEPKTKKQQ